MGQLSGGQDGNSVVGSAEVGHAHQSSDGELCASLPTDMAGQLLDDEVDAAIVPYQLQHASSQQGDYDELTHAQYAFAHGLKPSQNGHIGAETDEACGNQAQKQHSHHIHAQQGSDEYQQVGNHLHPLDRSYLGSGIQGETLHEVDAKHDEGGWQHDEDVHAELIAHLAVLCGGSGNGGIADE